MSAGYENFLLGTARYIEETLLPQERARLAAWETSARSSGVAEANIIAVLQSWNIWDQAMAELATVVIPTEVMRVQRGGADGVQSQYNPTQPPALPDVQQMLAGQGGALSGAAQYSGSSQTVTVARPAVDVPAVVTQSPSTALTNAIQNSAAVVSESGAPEPWEIVAGSEIPTNDTVEFPNDPTQPALGTGGEPRPPTVPPGLSGPVSDGPPPETKPAGLAGEVEEAAPRANVLGPLSSISGKVVLGIALLVLGAYIVTRKKKT